MKQFVRRSSETLAIGSGKRRAWLVLSVALLALLAWGVPVSAAELDERTKPEPGVLIVGVGEEMPAAEAGLARGDILLAIDGDMVNTAAELKHVILMRDPGDTLELTVKRGEEELTLTVTLGDRDGYPLLGVAAHDLRDGRMSPQRGRFRGMRELGPTFGMQRGMAFRFDGGRGAAVMEVLDDGPAAAADLRAGDLITAVDETEIAGIEDLVKAAAAYSPGDEVEFTVDRDGETITLTVTLGTHPDDQEKAYIGARILPSERFRLDMDENGRDDGMRRWNRFGFRFPNGRESDGRLFFKMMTDGALVMDVQDEGPAANAELEKGDVITAVDETEIANLEELVEALANYGPGDEVELTVHRDGETIQSAVTLGAHPDDETKAYFGVMIMPATPFRMHLEDSGEQVQEEPQREHESESSS